MLPSFFFSNNENEETLLLALAVSVLNVNFRMLVAKGNPIKPIWHRQDGNLVSCNIGSSWLAAIGAVDDRSASFKQLAHSDLKTEARKRYLFKPLEKFQASVRSKQRPFFLFLFLSFLLGVSPALSFFLPVRHVGEYINVYTQVHKE